MQPNLDCHRAINTTAKTGFDKDFLAANLCPLAQKLNCFYGRGIAVNGSGIAEGGDY